MMTRKAELLIAASFLILGLLAALVWIPNDTETWITEKFRRQVSMGDAFLPMVAASMICLFAAIQLVVVLFRPARQFKQITLFDFRALGFQALHISIVVFSLALMYWAGPTAVQILFSGDGSQAAGYRELRATYPYSLIGFALGGFTLVLGLTVLIEGRLKPVRILTSTLAVAALIALFNLPFENLLLPPNGDW